MHDCHRKLGSFFTSLIVNNQNESARPTTPGLIMIRAVNLTIAVMYYCFLTYNNLPKRFLLAHLSYHSQDSWRPREKLVESELSLASFCARVVNVVFVYCGELVSLPTDNSGSVLNFIPNVVNTKNNVLIKAIDSIFCFTTDLFSKYSTMI